MIWPFSKLWLRKTSRDIEYKDSLFLFLSFSLLFHLALLALLLLLLVFFFISEKNTLNNNIACKQTPECALKRCLFHPLSHTLKRETKSESLKFRNQITLRNLCMQKRSFYDLREVLKPIKIWKRAKEIEMILSS